MFPVKIDHPISTCKLPSNGKIIKFRPFLEKERKLLLMVAENKDDNLKDVLDVIKQIATNCIIDKIDINNLAIIDLEYIFLQLRSKSMGEIVPRSFICNNNNCNNMMKIDLDLTQVEVTNLDINKVIKISPTISIKMKFPTILSEEFVDDYDAITGCIEYVASSEQIYYAKDYNKDDLRDFITHLSLDQFHMLEEFFNNVPVLTTTLKHTCKKCGFNHEIIIEGLQSFFE